jgi:hypothetical protein
MRLTPSRGSIRLGFLAVLPKLVNIFFTVIAREAAGTCGQVNPEKRFSRTLGARIK